MLENLLDFFSQYQYLVAPFVFALGFAEGIVLVSLFIPSTALFLAIGSAHAAVGGEFWPVWLAGSAGAVLGDAVSFSGGRYYKEDVARVWPVSRYPDLLHKGRSFIVRWGWLSVLAGKFTGFARPFIPIFAGVLHMPLPVFLFASLVSSLMWAGVFLAPGYGINWLME